ncbi:RNA demethylase ALKBH9B-like [Amaranthus tricolor]|uniref:RNA demethylase ALKBH9B-like n=1 Tax=Amaranthus tricolor TaxID=29722 RepID=UPI00258D1BF3|nr:RNA demethylase ALKBH9B-like [Amaranthus tricolor]
MVGISAGESMKSLPQNDWINLLKNLDTSQIADLFNGVCLDCQTSLKSRLISIANEKSVKRPNGVDSSSSFSSETSTLSSTVNNNQQHSDHERNPHNRESNHSRQEINADYIYPASVNSKPQLRDLFSNCESSTSYGNHEPSSTVANGTADEEWRRFSRIQRKKDFVHYDRVDGKRLNVVQGLELHTGVFNAQEQKKIVESVYKFQRMGQKGELMARTYSEPHKWMRGKGRVTIQFGCCYNYAADKDGNPPGIIRDEEVDPMPSIFKEMITRMVKWHVLPPTCVPNSCIVNIYDEGDCIPPHIDHHDFLRPFCTVSFLTECNILFGSNLKILSPGEFSGPVSIPLPVGSVLVLKGNGADVAKHCVPAVPAKRISVTFRKMDDSKIPYQFSPDPDLLNLKPLVRSTLPKAGMAHRNQHEEIKINGEANKSNKSELASKSNAKATVSHSFILETNDFPPLGAMKSRKY